MTRPDIKGLLFDKDGTLFDFQATWAQVAIDLLAALSPDPDVQARMAHDVGFDLGARRFVPGSLIVAGSSAQSAAILADHRPDLGAARIESMANDLAERVVFSGGLVPAVPDLPGYLEDLAAAGYRLGIATHDSEAGARSHMRATGAHDQFDFIAGYDSGHGLKPGPGMLLAFASATGLNPGQIVMIGDSVHDLGVGPSAGAALTVGVLTGPATAADLGPYADHILPSIADLPALLATLGT